jgi:phosphatidate phosphatase APP1
MLRSALVRVEDTLQRGLAALLLRAGVPARIQPFPALVAGGTLRIGGRVLLGAVGNPKAARRLGRAAVIRANLKPFITFEVPRAEVEIRLAGRRLAVSADREGYFNAVLHDLDLPPGRHRVDMVPVRPRGESAPGTVYVADAAADLTVVSDIDDTIVDSGVARGLLATIRTAVLSDGSARMPLDGAPELYRALARPARGGPERPFIYLSTSPWNLVGFLEGFLHRHGFPAGPLALTDWGPGSAGLLRVPGRAHKLGVLQQLAADLPRLPFVLIGDSGQADPDIYTEFAVADPGRVAAVYIRRAGRTSATGVRRLEDCARRLQSVRVPFVVAEDSATILAHAAAMGLVGEGPH